MAIFTAVAGAIAGVLFGGSVLATTLIAGALAFGTQLLVSYLTRPKKRAYSANQDEIQIGGRVPAGVLFGKGATKGHHVYYAKYGSGNKYNADVFVLSNGWCDGLEPEVYFYGEKQTLVPRTIIGNEVEHWGIDGFDDKVSIRFYDGRPGQLADAKLVADTANLGNAWKSTSRLSGMAYVIVEREWDEELFEKGHPDFKFVMRGVREYDPRFDSTVAGGSGSQRLDDSSTWVWTENPAVHRLNYQLGLRGLISNRTLIGEGKSLGQLDLNSYFAAMNVSDTLREGKPTYQASLFVQGDDDHTEVLKEFDDAMAGYGMNRRGLSGVIVGAPQSPAATLTDADIDAERGKTIQHRKSAFDLYNHLSGQFISPEAHWEAESLKPIYVNADVSADGRVRQTANDFLQVTDPDIAQYLLQIRYRQQRKGGSATVPVSRRFGLRVMEGEWISYAGKTWLITGWQMDEELRITLTLAETGADVYASEGIEPGPIVVAPPTPVNPSLLSTVQNFDADGGYITNDAGKDIPAIYVTWDPPEDPSITQVRFEFRVVDEFGTPLTAEVMRDAMDAPEEGEFYITKGVIGETYYAVRATITTVPDRLKTFTPWVTTATTTGKFRYPIDLDQLEQDVTDFLDWTGAGARAAFDEIRALALQVANLSADDVMERQSLRREVVATSEDNRAFFEESIEVATGPNSALAQSITSLGVELGTKASVSSVDALTLVVQQNGNDISALASRTSALEIEMPGKASASALNAVQVQVNSVETVVGTKNRVFRQSGTPTATATGDLWIHTGENNRLYRWSGSAWQLSEDQRVPALQSSVSALADDISILDATVGQVSANVTLRATAQASPGDGYSRWGAQVRTSGSTWDSSAGFFIDTHSTQPSRFVVTADQFIVVSGGNAAAPLAFVGGTLYVTGARMQFAQIDNVSIGTAQIANGAITTAKIGNGEITSAWREPLHVGVL